MDLELFQLISEAKEGKQDAFEQLMTRYKGVVYRQAYAMLGDHMEAEDVTQEVFLKIYNSLSSLESPYAFTSWVTKITLNLCYDQIEKRKKKMAVTSENLDQLARSPSGGLIERKELLLTLQKTMQKLSLEHREVIILRDIQGYSYNEIAKILQVPVGTVKSRLYHARLALKNELSK
ncbi:RNA polymerase sigma factor [Tepidibacillus sp. LV47]|uniref:RNA polymerase sigma factor n=1 Tax=Tepidibacillus sp. LV47 TaxID=3398228 RepID=UPI003AAB5544